MGTARNQQSPATPGRALKKADERTKQCPSLVTCIAPLLSLWCHCVLASVLAEKLSTPPSGQAEALAGIEEQASCRPSPSKRYSTAVRRASVAAEEALRVSIAPTPKPQSNRHHSFPVSRFTASADAEVQILEPPLVQRVELTLARAV